jgi:hypothetical protein
MSPLEKITDFVLGSPGWRAFINCAVPILSGVFTGVFIAQITGPNGLLWEKWATAWGLYPLAFLIIVLFLYNRALYRRETEVLKFADSAFCMAYVRSKCLPQAAERYKEMIRTGHGGELAQVMAELKKSLK